jgi:hypothetical protein
LPINACRVPPVIAGTVKHTKYGQEIQIRAALQHCNKLASGSAR